MLECDRKLELAIASMAAEVDVPLAPLPKIRTKTKQVNAPSFDVRAALYGLVGIDLTQIHGPGSSLALKLIGECGTDLRAWPTAKHFTSWLCLAPGNKISGGRLLSSRTRRSSSRAESLCGWQPPRLAGAIRRWVHFIDVWQGVSESRKP
ncbi:transposase [Rhizobium sp. RAF56]